MADVRSRVGSHYRTRFAPSPTGDLHLGSLVAAVASYLCARRAAGEWLVRIEDLDPPRTVPGSADRILHALETLGFDWHGPVLYQSTRSHAYEQAVEALLARGRAYPCSCSRTELMSAQPANRTPGEELFYPGWCRTTVRHPERDCAIRFRTSPEPVLVNDEVQGPALFDLTTLCGDFVIRRRDGLFAYQLAVVVDDAAQGITHVVRGIDLLTSTPRQIQLQQALGLPAIEYAHMPVVIDANRSKLSKSAGAAALDLTQPARELWRALKILKQDPPPELCLTDVGTVWAWARDHWRIQPLLGLRAVQEAEFATAP